MQYNINPETGIRYGVVYLKALEPWVFEEFIDHGEDLDYIAAKEECLGEDYTDEEEQYFADNYDSDCVGTYELNKDGMKLGMSSLGGAPLVWVFESPHIAQCRECSPCIPNAGNLECKDDHGFETYDVPPDWYAQEEEYEEV